MRTAGSHDHCQPVLRNRPCTSVRLSNGAVPWRPCEALALVQTGGLLRTNGSGAD